MWLEKEDQLCQSLIYVQVFQLLLLLVLLLLLFITISTTIIKTITYQ